MTCRLVALVLLLLTVTPMANRASADAGVQQSVHWQPSTCPITPRNGVDLFPGTQYSDWNSDKVMTLIYIGIQPLRLEKVRPHTLAVLPDGYRVPNQYVGGPHMVKVYFLCKALPNNLGFVKHPPPFAAANGCASTPYEVWRKMGPRVPNGDSYWHPIFGSDCSYHYDGGFSLGSTTKPVKIPANYYTQVDTTFFFPGDYYTPGITNTIDLLYTGPTVP